MRGGLSYLEANIAGHWLALDRMTQADITTAALVGYLKLRAPEVDVARDYPRLQRLSDVCEAMPSFVAARPGPEEVMPT
jgi:glutathione S-transferase